MLTHGHAIGALSLQALIPDLEQSHILTRGLPACQLAATLQPAQLSKAPPSAAAELSKVPQSAAQSQHAFCLIQGRLCGLEAVLCEDGMRAWLQIWLSASVDLLILLSCRQVAAGGLQKQLLWRLKEGMLYQAVNPDV